MLNVNTNTDIVPSTKSMCNLLTSQNMEHGIYLDYDRLLEYHFYYRNEAARIGVILHRFLNPNSVDKDSVATPGEVETFIRNSGLSMLFGKTDKGSISLEKESVESAVNSGVMNDEQKQVMNLWSYLTGCNSKVGQFGTVLRMNLPIEKELTFDYHRMIRFYPVWEAQNTHRFATKVPALQNFGKEVQDVLTVPRGFVYCDSDSGQIEPNITYSTIIRDEQIRTAIKQYRDAYFGILFYVQMDNGLWLSKRTDFTVPEVTDEMKKMRAQLKRMGNAILYGSGDDKGGDPLYLAYKNRIGNHPKRLEYVNKCKQQLMSGDYIFYTAFNEPVDVREASNAKGKYSNASEDAKIKHYIRSAFNVKMQGTAAGLMKLALNEEYKYIQRYSLKSFIFASVHDAIKSAIHEDEFDKHAKIIGDFPAYQVDDWLPINAGAVFGGHRTNDIFTDKVF